MRTKYLGRLDAKTIRLKCKDLADIGFRYGTTAKGEEHDCNWSKRCDKLFCAC